MIKTILLDIGNVLLFVRNVHAGLDISNYNPLKKYVLSSRVRAYEKGKIPTEEFYTWFCKKTKQDIRNLNELFEDVFSLNEDMVSLVEKLKKTHRLVALSNTNEANYNFFSKKYSIFDIFDDYVLSYKVGSLKPESKIYEVALGKALCKPEECVFIDDNRKFVNAAKKLGINAIQYDYRKHLDLEKKLKELRVL